MKTTRNFRCEPKHSGGCAARLTLPRLPQEYAHRPARFRPKQWTALLTGFCPFCTKGRLYEVTKGVNKWNKQVRCDCGGPLHYPHSKGSSGCLYGEGW